MAEKNLEESFELIENEDNQEKIKKRNLAIKYLESINDSEKIKKTKQILNALEYLSDCFESNDDLSFKNLPDEYKTTAVQVLINLIKIVLNVFKTNKSLENSESQTYSSILSQVIKSIFILASKSTEFCLQYQEKNSKSIDLLIEILQESGKAEKALFFLEDDIYRHLLMSLVCLARYQTKYPSNWIGATKCLKNFKNKLKDLNEFDYNWYLFLINENLNKTDNNYLDFDFSFEINLDELPSEKTFRRNFGIKFLQFLNESIAMFESEQTMNVIYYICDINSESFDEIDADLQDFFVSGLIDLLKYCIMDFLNQLNKDSKRDIQNATPEKQSKQKSKPKLNLKKSIKKNLVLIEKITQIVQNYSNSSYVYCIKFHKVPQSISMLFDFIKNEQLSDYLAENITKKMTSYLLKDCYEGVIGSLHNLSRLENRFKSIWNGCDALNSCIKFSDKLGPIDEHYRFYVYMIIANIATDKQIDTLPEIKIAIKSISDLIKNCADLLGKEEPAERTKIQVQENEEVIDILCYHNGMQEWNLVELLEGLYRMSVNDNIKKEIYETNSMRDYLKKLILLGNTPEKEYALKLLYQLCFDENITDDLLKDTEFVTFLNNLSTNPEIKSNKLKKNCESILWILENKKKETTPNATNLPEKKTVESEQSQVKKTVEKHVMISYNRESRDICLSIKNELEKSGYEVWIDVEDIRGSSLESMATAIEESQCVLMGMTEKYKLSSNCRLEAEYAVQLNKPIIPLILQKDYKPDGWLGIILGSKMFVNFKKYSFEECMRRLMAEISTVFKKAKNSTEIIPKIEENIDSKKKTVEHRGELKGKPPGKEEKISWSEKDVENWLNEKKFHQSIIDNIKPCTGKTLYQMYLILQAAPEFFYCAMRTDSNNNIHLKDLASFSFELAALFKEN